jgi:hypothetical protein
LPTREQFFTRSQGCGLSDIQIYELYRLLRKTAILYDQQRRGSAAERGKLETKISLLLQDIGTPSCAFFREFIARLEQDDLNIIRQAHSKGYSPFALSRAILDHHATIYLDLLNWNESDREYMNKVISRLEKRRKKALGSKTWKYGLLAGVTAVGLGAGIYLHSIHKKSIHNE